MREWVCRMQEILSGNVMQEKVPEQGRLFYTCKDGGSIWPPEHILTKNRCLLYMGFLGGSLSKESTCHFRRHWRHDFNSWVGKISLEEKMATHSCILAWKIPWTEEPCGLQSIGLQRVGHDNIHKEIGMLVTCLHF